MSKKMVFLPHPVQFSNKGCIPAWQFIRIRSFFLCFCLNTQFFMTSRKFLKTPSFLLKSRMLTTTKCLVNFPISHSPSNRIFLSPRISKSFFLQISIRRPHILECSHKQELFHFIQKIFFKSEIGGIYRKVPLKSSFELRLRKRRFLKFLYANPIDFLNMSIN